MRCWTRDSSESNLALNSRRENLGGVEIFHPALFFGKLRSMTGFSVAVIICTAYTVANFVRLERAHENYRSGSFVACGVIGGRSK